MILDCYKILKQMERKPAMWVGENTLKAIHLYISGYYHALLDEGVVTAAHTDEPFFDWVADKLGYFESTAGWVNMIVAESMGFESKNISWEEVFETPTTKEQHSISINRFYELLEEFKKEMEEQSITKPKLH
tara:strand:- start:184 stop:579 length:396 start_codon:yes stop_codon:yes gene_type:complete